MIVLLSETASESERAVGGKAKTLGRLIDAGHRVPEGFCVGVRAYERFIASGDRLNLPIALRRPGPTARCQLKPCFPCTVVAVIPCA